MLVDHNIWVYFWVLCSFLLTMCLCRYHTFLMIGALQYIQREARECDTATSVLVSQDYFGQLRSFMFPHEFQYYFSSSVNNAYLYADCIESIDCLGQYGHFNNNLPVHEHGIFLLKNCIYFWLRWVFVALCSLFLVAVNRAALHCDGGLLTAVTSLVESTAVGACASVAAAHRLSSCGLQAIEHRRSSCDAPAQLLCTCSAYGIFPDQG